MGVGRGFDDRQGGPHNHSKPLFWGKQVFQQGSVPCYSRLLRYFLQPVTRKSASGLAWQRNSSRLSVVLTDSR